MGFLAFASAEDAEKSKRRIEGESNLFGGGRLNPAHGKPLAYNSHDSEFQTRYGWTTEEMNPNYLHDILSGAIFERTVNHSASGSSKRPRLDTKISAPPPSSRLSSGSGSFSPSDFLMDDSNGGTWKDRMNLMYGDVLDW
jgi:hypothetical protein